MLHLNKSKIMGLFFEEPSKNFQIREISRLTKIAVTSVKKYLEELLKEGLIKKSTKTLYPSYIAEESNKMFTIYKQQRIIYQLQLSGLLDYLTEKTLPRCIILFGSAAKGSYNKDSDIDLFIQSSEKSLDLKSFEKKLVHKINILFEPELKNLSKELFNNILNGVVLYGFAKWR